MGETEKKKVDYGTVDVVAEIEHGRLVRVDNASNRTPPGAMPKGKRVKGEPKLCTMQREEKSARRESQRIITVIRPKPSSLVPCPVGERKVFRIVG